MSSPVAGSICSDSSPNELARAHSRAMASGRVRLGHSGFDERAASLARSGGLQHTAENVSKHRGRSVEEVAAVALEMWLKSRSHRANLEGDFQLTGVGAARGRDGVIYLTQIFAAP